MSLLSILFHRRSGDVGRVCCPPVILPSVPPVSHCPFSRKIQRHRLHFFYVTFAFSSHRSRNLPLPPSRSGDITAPFPRLSGHVFGPTLGHESRRFAPSLFPKLSCAPESCRQFFFLSSSKFRIAHRVPPPPFRYPFREMLFPEENAPFRRFLSAAFAISAQS